MTAYKDLSKEELLELKSGLEAQFEEVKAKGLKLDMSRGKPSADQLNLSMGSCILFYFFVFFSFIFTCFAFQKCFSFIFHYIPCYHSIPSGFIYALLIFSPLL